MTWGSFWNGTSTSENWGEWGIFGGDVAAASNFDISVFTNYMCDSWLVSPSINLSSSTAPYLTFDNVQWTFIFCTVSTLNCTEQ